MSRRARLPVVVAVGAVVFGVPVGLRVAGDRQVNHEVERIRAASAVVRIDMSMMLAPMFDARAQNPVAKSLGVSDSAVSLQQGASGWCTEITVRRLISQQSVFMALSPDGTLLHVVRCT